MIGALAGAAISGGAKLLSGVLGGMSQEQLATDMKRKARLADQANSRFIDKYNQDLEGRIGEASDYAREQGERGETVTTDMHTDSLGGTFADVGAMMEAAEKYGFNPLSFLRNGGLQAFTGNWGSTHEWGTVNQTNRMGAAELMMQGALSPRQLHQTQSEYASGGNIAGATPNWGNIVGDSLTTGVDTYMNLQQQEFSNNLSEKYLQSSLQGLNKAAGGKQIARSFYVPSSVGGGKRVSDEMGTLTNPADAYLFVRDNNKGSRTYGQVLAVPNQKYIPDNDTLMTMPALRLGFEQYNRQTNTVESELQRDADAAWKAIKGYFDPWINPKGANGVPLRLDIN